MTGVGARVSDLDTIDVAYAWCPALRMSMGGIAKDGASGFCVAFEVRTDRRISRAIYTIDEDREITSKIPLLPELLRAET